jgi:tetratricopeptide (TPR) repeat protein
VRGRARLALGDPGAALPDLENAAHLDPTLLDTRIALVGAYQALREPDKALDEAARIAGQFPKQARVHYAYAAMLDQCQQWPQAEHEYREALRVDPEMNAAKLALAVVLLNQHKGYDEVQHLASDVDTVAPGDGTAAAISAWALYLSGKQDAGLRALIAVSQAHPGNLQVLRWIREGALQTGNLALADSAAKLLNDRTHPAPKK